MFFYRLGHSPALAVAELANLAKTNSESTFSYQKNDKILVTAKNFENRHKIAGIVYSGKVLGEVVNKDDLATFLYELFNKEPNKKLGLSLPESFANNIINFCHEIGFKKVNLLIDREPNIGHFNLNIPWIIVFELDSKFYCGLVESFSNQNIFSNLDTGMPAGSMKRGKMNLKLALSLINLSSHPDSDYIWDPFCGQGGILLINSVFGHKASIATDFDRQAIRSTRANLEWLSKNPEFNLDPKATNLHIERLDAATLASSAKDSNLEGIARKNDPKFAFNKVSIVTEGTLGPIYSRQLPERYELIANLEEIAKMWRNVLNDAKKLGILEIIFCIPYYRINSEILCISNFEKLIPEGYKLDKLLDTLTEIDYSRAKTLVGHRIQKIIKIN